MGGTENVLAEEPRYIPYSFADIAEKVKPVVVNINTSQTLHPILNQGNNMSRNKFFEGFPYGENKRRNLGSGVIIDQEGYIITNNHVIEGADEIQVKLSNEEEFEAQIIGKDAKTDIALIRIEAEAKIFPAAQLGNQGGFSATRRSCNNDPLKPFPVRKADPFDIRCSFNFFSGQRHFIIYF